MMKSLKIFTGILALSLVTGIGYAQVVDPKAVAKDDATDRTNSNIESGVDNGVGKAEGAIKGLFKKKKPANAQQQQTQQMQPTGGSGFKAYNNYDFVPGDSIVFEDHFIDDADGEFPAHWNLVRGQAVVNSIGDKKVFSLTDGNYAHVSPLIKSASYMADPFTIEFDSYSTGGYQPHLFFYGTNANAIAANGDLGEVSIGSGNTWTGAEFTNNAGTVKLEANYPADISGDQYLNKWHHIAIAYKKGQLKVYVDQYRVLVVPNIGFAPHAFDIEAIGDQSAPVMMANFRIANGGKMNMLGRKFTDAKIITHGINFDIDKATIKPESMGTLNMVAGVMRDNPDIKFEIDGHTDNTGTAAHNVFLSQARGAAVKEQLVSMGVDGSRLTTMGFGDTRPLADNSTLEGKANNRRVEFVKQ
jgi:OOP family OmpA-OmpF porin